MRFTMESVGILPDMSLDLDGITVITGLNGTGKSTILKTIYSILESSDLENRKDLESYFALVPILRRKDPDILKKSPYRGLESLQFYLDSLRTYNDLSPDEKEVVDYTERLISGKEDDSFHRSVLISNLRSEFVTLSQFSSDGTDGLSRVIVEHLGEERRLDVSNDNLGWHGEYKDLPGVAYYDTPFILDGLAGAYTDGHRASISQMVISNRNHGIVAGTISDRRLEDFDRCIASVLPGDVVYDKNRGALDYVQPGKKTLGIRNLAAGMKVFAILRKLIENGYITEDFVMLLDEPEIHLHPQWQVVLAEALVILNKSVGCRILMTTHSPLLLRSLQAYSQIYGRDIRYYLLDRDSERVGERTDITFRDLGSDPEKAYKTMSEAFNRAQDLFYGE